MRLKSAKAWFQGYLASMVLAGLIYFICELYVDDVIVHGKTKEQFLHNLEEVFKRFQKYNIIISPSKTYVGMSDIEFVGHTINQEGITFSREKIDKVLAIPELTLSLFPRTHTKLC